jgi:hypothetical protein
MPRPPNFFALHALTQLTGQLPLLGSSLPFHKKSLRMRSMRLIAHLDSGKDVIWYTGTAVKTEFTSARRPALVRRRPFHPGRRAPTLFTRTCSSARLVRPRCSGNPRYLVGNVPN